MKTVLVDATALWDGGRFARAQCFTRDLSDRARAEEGRALLAAIIEASDEVLLVGSMDIPSIKNLKIGMQQLDLQALAGPKLKLVLNHANAKVKLDVVE